MSQILWFSIYLAIVFQTCYAPPVSQNKKENDHEEADVNGLEDYMEYHRYLKEVVGLLESDPEFRQKLEKADPDDIKSGKIAEDLHFVDHRVRQQLDEVKRVELERLKELMEKKRKLEDPSNSIDEDPLHHHLDHSNPHTFEIEDLKKLIKKTTDDLAEVDRQRKEKFKQYELEKEYQKQEKLNHTNGEEHEKLEKQYHDLEEKHKKHEKLHEPGHKAQLEEVWEEQDQMQQEFDPKAFFMLHDVDGNGVWDQNEVKALFVRELNKMYEQGAPEDDMRERFEEMERMRETVFSEMDKNRDGFIDFNEFLHQTNTAEYKEDNGWKSLDEQRPFTDEELAEYIRQNHPEVPPGAYELHQVPSGQPMPPGYQQPPPPGGYQQVPPGAYQQVPHGGYQGVPPGPGGYQPVPPAGYQQVPPGGYQGGYQQVPPGGYQQVPPGGYQQVHPNPSGGQQVNPGQQQHNGAQGIDLNTNEILPHQQAVQPPQQNYNQQQQFNQQQHQQPGLQQPNQIQQQHQQNFQQQPNQQPPPQQVNQHPPPQQVNQQPPLQPNHQQQQQQQQAQQGNQQHQVPQGVNQQNPNPPQANYQQQQGNPPQQQHVNPHQQPPNVKLSNNLR